MKSKEARKRIKLQQGKANCEVKKVVGLLCVWTALPLYRDQASAWRDVTERSEGG